MAVARFACVASCLASSVAAHGSLTLPVPRNNKGAQPPFGRTIYHNPGCQGDACLWFNEGCYNGCPSCTGAMPNNTQGGSANTYGAPDTRDCPAPSEPTLPEAFRTWNIQNLSSRGDFTKYHPWRSPGKAPTSDPCGVASGYPNGKLNGNQVPAGYQRGQAGSSLPPAAANATATWQKGALTDVGWTITANHGGGYAYSVCPKATTPLTEACLHAHPLQFAGSNHTIRYSDGRAELQIPARTVSQGTYPAGSQWRMNPIPACNCDQGFGCSSSP